MLLREIYENGITSNGENGSYDKLHLPNSRLSFFPMAAIVFNNTTKFKAWVNTTINPLALALLPI